MVHTPLGPPTTWVHIFLDTFDVMNEYQMTNNEKDTVRWLLNNEVGFGAICHNSRGNLIDGLGNPIKETEEVVEEEEKQDRDEEFRLRLRL